MNGLRISQKITCSICNACPRNLSILIFRDLRLSVFTSVRLEENLVFRKLIRTRGIYMMSIKIPISLLFFAMKGLLKRKGMI